MRKVEGGGKKKDKDGDGEVDPLHVGEGVLVAKVEEDVGAEDGRDDGADAVEGLGDVDANLGESRRAAYCTPLAIGPLHLHIRAGRDEGHTGDEGVGGRLEGAEAIADDEDASAEAAEALGLEGRDGK